MSSYIFPREEVGWFGSRICACIFDNPFSSPIFSEHATPWEKKLSSYCNNPVIKGVPAVLEAGELLVQFRVLGQLETKIYIMDKASAWGQVHGFGFGFWTLAYGQGILTLTAHGLLLNWLED